MNHVLNFCSGKCSLEECLKCLIHDNFTYSFRTYIVIHIIHLSLSWSGQIKTLTIWTNVNDWIMTSMSWLAHLLLLYICVTVRLGREHQFMFVWVTIHTSLNWRCSRSSLGHNSRTCELFSQEDENSHLVNLNFNFQKDNLCLESSKSLSAR